MTGAPDHSSVDPLERVTALLEPVFSELAGAPTDPVVRPSDHADAQVNGALPLAKALGRNRIATQDDTGPTLKAR